MPASISDQASFGAPSTGTGRTSMPDRTLTDRSTLHPTLSVDEHDTCCGSRTKTRSQKHGASSQTGSFINTPHDAEASSRAGASYFEGPTSSPQAHPPGPSQFLAAKGRQMSFYEMQEQAKLARKEAKLHAKKQKRASLQAMQRQSWQSGTMPYNYADIIGDNRNNYRPPAMGNSRRDNGNRWSTGTFNVQSIAETSQPFNMRLPWTMWMHSEAKNLFVAALGEWVGTTLFLFFAFAGTQVANAGSKTSAETTTNATAGFDPVVMLYIAVSFGFSLMVNVWVFFRISGGLFNPAVTLALWAVRAVSAKRAIVLFVSQIVGSITASALVLALFPTPLNVRTTLSEGTSEVQGVFIEAFMTAELVFTILMLAKEKHKSTFIAPVGIGLALFVAELVGVYYTGGSLNPARSLGPCIVTLSFDRAHWVYWVGPCVGSILSVAFYQFIKMLEYEMANPGQDGDDENDPTKNPNHELREKQREMTMRILSSLGMDGSQQQRSPERSAEEGSHTAPSVEDAMSDQGSRHNPVVALSTVHSMSDHITSPIRAQHEFSSPRSSTQGYNDRAPRSVS